VLDEEDNKQTICLDLE
jgi:hypothetical protein